jgi:hypothetical protein
MAGSRLGQWPCLVVCILILLKAEGASIPITIVETAVSSGAGEQLISSFVLC